MPRKDRARISIRSKPVISVNKELLKLIDTKKQIVYLFLAQRPVKYYFHRRSRIVYIGKTTRKGDRPFESLKKKAESLMRDKSIKPRVRHIDVGYLQATGRKGADIVDKFERVCLHQFRCQYGRLPYGNVVGKGRLELSNEGQFFSLDRVTASIKHFSS